MIRDELCKGFDVVDDDNIELKEFLLLWHHTEYVIGGAPTYTFGALAAHKLLK